eukprot:CAMPEP_0119329684 /NCGR_PEP_ID=MMETSP1333-20130426/76468_1 /TAXON_ID=418940 /ORGANISM="Scyphosphaera apsteinii, Strain RCC1455" /LENGTH=54 /DNA_ID=CAMNT_0007338861 /DNA_START=29 /DNA_END=190 /DNA_ORIENTATION=+
MSILIHNKAVRNPHCYRAHRYMFKRIHTFWGANRQTTAMSELTRNVVATREEYA